MKENTSTTMELPLKDKLDAHIVAVRFRQIGFEFVEIHGSHRCTGSAFDLRHPLQYVRPERLREPCSNFLNKKMSFGTGDACQIL